MIFAILLSIFKLFFAEIFGLIGFDGRPVKIEKAHYKIVPCSFIKHQIPLEFSL